MHCLHKAQLKTISFCANTIKFSIKRFYPFFLHEAKTYARKCSYKCKHRILMLMGYANFFAEQEWSKKNIWEMSSLFANMFILCGEVCFVCLFNWILVKSLLEIQFFQPPSYLNDEGSVFSSTKQIEFFSLGFQETFWWILKFGHKSHVTLKALCKYLKLFSLSSITSLNTWQSRAVHKEWERHKPHLYCARRWLSNKI